MIEIETRMRIERPIEDVFDYMADPRNFPRWNSAVRSVIETAVTEDGAGATYTMQTQPPHGQHDERPRGRVAPPASRVRDHNDLRANAIHLRHRVHARQPRDRREAQRPSGARSNRRSYRAGRTHRSQARRTREPGNAQKDPREAAKRLTAVRCSVSPQGPLRSPDVSRRGGHPSGLRPCIRVAAGISTATGSDLSCAATRAALVSVRRTTQS
jgi:hypothetical protein